MSDTLIKNMTLLSQNTLNGFGGIGEGVSMQVTQDGRRIIWLAHEGAPKNFTGVDVTDPKNTKKFISSCHSRPKKLCFFKSKLD